MLVGMARLSALAESIEHGHLVFLDTFPDGPETFRRIGIGGDRETASQMLLENRSQLDQSRSYFRENADAGELAWERIEERSNRYYEISEALQTIGYAKGA